MLLDRVMLSVSFRVLLWIQATVLGAFFEAFIFYFFSSSGGWGDITL